MERTTLASKRRVDLAAPSPPSGGTTTEARTFASPVTCLAPQVGGDRIRIMRRKSDKARAARRVSATEASRTFSVLLDEIEAGRRFLVHRHRRDVCLMGPPTMGGRRASECLELLRARSPVLLDDGFGADLMRVLAEESTDERPSWGS